MIPQERIDKEELCPRFLLDFVVMGVLSSYPWSIVRIEAQATTN